MIELNEITEPDEITDLIINHLGKKKNSGYDIYFAEEIGISYEKLMWQLVFLEKHNVAKSDNNYIKKLHNFEKVYLAGGLKNYLQRFNIEALHENIYSFLREKHPQIMFSLRSANNNGRLSKGYWLLGNDKMIMLSFLKSNDIINKTPNIYFVIEITGRCYLQMSALDSDKKAEILQDLAIVLDAKATKREDKIYFWRKYYDGIDSYLGALEVFLETKQKIDIYLRHYKDWFPDYTPSLFEANVAKIEELRKEKQRNTLANIPTFAKHWQLEAIEITNISHFSELSIPLNQNIICFIGENGTGKSTILRAILLGMIGIDYLEIENKNIQDLLTIIGANKKGKEFAQLGTIKVQNTYHNGTIKQETHKIDITNNYPKWHEFMNVGDDFTILGEKTDTFQQLIIGFGQQAKPQEKTLEGTLDEPNIEDVKSLLYNEPDIRFNKFVSWLQQSMDTQVPASERIAMAPIITQIFEVISEITGNTIQLIHELGGQEVKIMSDEHPNGLPLHLISQGYNNVIGWVGFFMKRLWESTAQDKKNTFKETYATCFIDEIDTYLHPKWQRTILATLVKHFPNTQFIVTTHSPFVLTYLPNENDSVLIYKIMQNGEITPLQAAGRDIRSFLLEWFEISERPEFAQKEIDDLYQAFEVESPNFTELRDTIKRLREKYTDNDPDLLKAEHILNVLED